MMCLMTCSWSQWYCCPLCARKPLDLLSEAENWSLFVRGCYQGGSVGAQHDQMKENTKDVHPQIFFKVISYM